MNTQEQILHSIRSPHPSIALRKLVEDLLKNGIEKVAIARSLEEFVIQHRDLKDLREEDEEAIFDLLDALSGWCHPVAQINSLQG